MKRVTTNALVDIGCLARCRGLLPGVEAFGMGGEQQPQDAQPRLRAHRRQHVGVAGGLAGVVLLGHRRVPCLSIILR